jgi:hypothetical protein
MNAGGVPCWPSLVSALTGNLSNHGNGLLLAQESRTISVGQGVQRGVDDLLNQYNDSKQRNLKHDHCRRRDLLP